MKKLQTIEDVSKIFDELKEEFMEMGRLKSDFDIEKFTVKKEGHFIAHNYHFLIRQYRFAVSELKRMLIEKERKQRELDKLDKEKPENYDLDMMETQRQIDELDIDMVNKKGMINGFETCRRELIKQNGGKFTDKQYQSEEPQYWSQYLKKRALDQLRERATGIKEGVSEAIRQLEDKPLLEGSQNQVVILDNRGGFDRLDWEREVQESMGMDNRVQLIDSVKQQLKLKSKK